MIDEKVTGEFMDIYERCIKRPGADKLLQWLKLSDFFTAPASTRFHLAKEGGLVEHSINVYKRLRKLWVSEWGEPDAAREDTIAVCGLLHDVCKTKMYKVATRNAKNEATGQWEKVPYYTIEEQFPYGHGEKSVYILGKFLRLSRDEVMAIRWHMGFSDNEFKAGGFGVGKAFEQCQLALLTHMADLQATYIDEVRGEATT
ncbi:MAG: HD domain-containing protein [Roseburia sp.]|nr:HD domain-containing protein [Roseburia sp.]